MRFSNASHSRLRSLFLVPLGLSACVAFDQPSSPGETEATAVVAEALNSSLPEAPAFARDVAMIVGGQYTRPVVPPFRTSADGRVAMNVKAPDNKPVFYLFTPEKLTSPIAANAPGATMLASTTAVNFGLTESSLHRHDASLGRGVVTNRTLCDASSAFPEASVTTNPTACGSSDCYSLTVIAAYNYVGANGKTSVELWGTPLSVRVDNPKTANARLGSITAGTPVKGPTWPIFSFLEPMITSDGHLLVARTPDSQFTWPSSTGPVTGSYNMVYSPGNPSASPCDVTQWTQLYPISHAPYDSAVNERYGFARVPFRDPEGAVVPDGVEFKGSYPWIDRGGKNLFFTSVSAMFFYGSSGTVKTRYPATCVPGQSCVNPTTTSTIALEEEASNTRGVSVAGLWTHGKMVLLDNLLNNIDYGLRIADDDQRLVSLYQPGTGPLGTESGDVRLGSGRFNSGSAGWPAGSPANTSFIDSLENLFNHVPNARPLTVRDVVWTMNTGRGSDEVAFDDYLDPDVFIFSEMAGSQSFSGGAMPKELYYHDGFVRTSLQNGSGFSDNEQVRVQNAATAPSERWAVPAYGRVTGGGRLEPAALGGVRGKGLWLDGSDDTIEYTVGAQPQDIGNVPFYASLFVDSRFSDDTTARRLLTFPDGSGIDVVGRHAVRYVSSGGVTLHTALLPASKPLAYKGFSHLGFVVDGGGTQVELYLDGFLLDSWTGSTALFRLSPGTFRVGSAPGAAGVRGWVDEVKVILRRPDPESACNHARGTLIGLPEGYSGDWADAASRYPAASHDALSSRLTLAAQPSFAKYACFVDYASELGAHLGAVPAGASSVRHSVLAPEATLVYGTPRPDTSANAFCRSCHVDGNPASLGIEALLPSSLLMEDDPRRQPFQPPRLVFGNVPAGYVPATGLPSTAQTATSTGFELDAWVFP